MFSVRQTRLLPVYCLTEYRFYFQMIEWAAHADVRVPIAVSVVQIRELFIVSLQAINGRDFQTNKTSFIFS